MDFFENLGNKVSEAGSSLSRRARNYSDQARIEADMSMAQAELDRTYNNLGRMFYDKLKGREVPEEEAKALAERVDLIGRDLQEMHRQYNLIRGLVSCSKCGADVPIGTAYCPACGSPIPQAQPAPQAAPQGPVCISCGQILSPGAQFCPRCGTKQEAAN